MVELADTMDLGSIGQPCRFKSCYPHQKERHDVSRVFLFGFQPPKAASTLWFKMLGGNEFRLRRGFACGKTLVRRKSAAGQKAG